MELRTSQKVCILSLILRILEFGRLVLIQQYLMNKGFEILHNFKPKLVEFSKYHKKLLFQCPVTAALSTFGILLSAHLCRRYVKHLNLD